MIIDTATKKSILLKMQSNSVHVDQKSSRIKALIYGASGVGKTVLAVAIARQLIGPNKDIIFVDVDEGYESLRNHPSLLKRVIPIQYDSVEQLYVIAEAVAHGGHKPFDNVGAIIFDDADFMAAQDLNELWHNRVINSPTSKLDPEKPERPEYLKLGFRFNEVLDFIYSHTPNVHLFLTTQEKEKKSQDGSVVLNVFPGFNPALAGEVKAKLLIVCRMTAKEVKDGDNANYVRTVQVHPTMMVDAKTRIGCNKIRYDATDFLHHVVNWVESGRPEDKEIDAVRVDISTKKMVTPEDIVIGGTDDDTPAFFQ